MSPPRNKVILAAGVVVATAFVSYTTIYLPFYSPEMEELKKKGVQNRSSTSKSMWVNLDKEIKDTKESK